MRGAGVRSRDGAAAMGGAPDRSNDEHYVRKTQPRRTRMKKGPLSHLALQSNPIPATGRVSDYDTSETCPR
jgi:hypothetical protein